MKPTILFIPLIMLFLSCDAKDGADDGSVNVTISISFPEDQSTVNDSVLIQCEVSNDNLVSKIELWVDGDSTGIHDLSSPFSVIWDTRYYENGSHSFFVRSYDDQENKFDISAEIIRKEYDPNRSAFISLIKYDDGEFNYIICPQKVKVGDKVISSKNAEIKDGNCLPLKKHVLTQHAICVIFKTGKHC